MITDKDSKTSDISVASGTTYMEQVASKSTYFGDSECSKAGKHFATALVPARKARRIEFRAPNLETSAPG